MVTFREATELDATYMKASAPADGVVVLAREPDFWLGSRTVRPSRGEVDGPEGSQRLEPRVMQVLVVLARAQGVTVARDELVARCWGGLNVSDHAVNRVISRLRRLSREPPSGFHITTLPRIGYRLIAEPTEPAAAPPPRRAPGADISDGGTSRSANVPPPIAPQTGELRDSIVRDLHARALLALEQPSREPTEQARAYLAEAVARAPAFAPGWAGLAEAQRLLALYQPPPEQPPFVAESRRSAERALALDPGLGQSFGTLAMLTPRLGHWAEVHGLFEQGLAAAPDHPGLLHQYAQFLLSVGRTREGLASLLELQSRNPLSAGLAIDTATALFDADREPEALAAVSRAHALWPAIMLVWSECVRLHVVTGDYPRAEAMLDRPPPPVMAGDVNVARRRLHLVANRDGRPQDMAAAVDNFLRFAEIGVAPATVAIHALTTLKQAEPAIAVADRIFRADAPQTVRPGVNMMGAYTLAGEPDTTVLFRRDTALIRRSPEVAHIFDRIGLRDFWRNSTAPDFLTPTP